MTKSLTKCNICCILHACVLECEDKNMKVSAIQSYSVNGLSKVKSNHRVREQLPPVNQSMPSDSVSFQGKAAAGATIGGLLGAAAITLISGGAAIPLIVGAYTIGGAAIGAGVGEAFGEDKDKDNKKDE